MKKIGRRLVRCNGRHARPLPWRTDPSPYRVWVSEVMLQQTAVTTVIRDFERWMQRFPDAHRWRARASGRRSLSGKGMVDYGRARRLWAAAHRIMEEHGGAVPRGTAQLRRLPGVGPYVAAAIRSFAFGEDEVALDANLVRVFMRLLGSRAAARRRRCGARWRTGARRHAARSVGRLQPGADGLRQPGLPAARAALRRVLPAPRVRRLPARHAGPHPAPVPVLAEEG